MPFVNEKTGKVATGTLIVYPGAIENPADPDDVIGDVDGIGVQVDPDGRVTNVWGDGTRGVPEDVISMAADETEAYEPYDLDQRYIWKQPTSKNPKSAPQ